MLASPEAYHGALEGFEGVLGPGQPLGLTHDMYPGIAFNEAYSLAYLWWEDCGLYRPPQAAELRSTARG